MKNSFVEEYRHIIKSRTISTINLDSSEFGLIIDLCSSIEKGKTKLKVNSVEFMVAKLFNSKNENIDIKRKGYFEIFVFGEFKKTFEPTMKVSQALSDFYLEYGILPRLITVPREVTFLDFSKLSKIVEKGVLIYERK